MSLNKLLGMPEYFSEHGGTVDHLIEIVQWFMVILFIGWTVFFFVCLWKFRAKKNPKASYHGVQGHLTTHLEIGVVIIEAVLLIGFAIPLWKTRTDSYEVVQQRDPARVRVIGYQFAWNYHYPGADGVFGRVDYALVNNLGDPCIDPEDPNGWDDFTSPVLKLPVNRPAILSVTSTDVIHNYAIVPMRIQQDCIPGKDIPMWFTPTKELETYTVCAQLCGAGHANMRGIMETISQSSYDGWVEEQSAAAKKKNTPTGNSVAATE